MNTFGIHFFFIFVLPWKIENIIKVRKLCKLVDTLLAFFLTVIGIGQNYLDLLLKPHTTHTQLTHITKYITFAT